MPNEVSVSAPLEMQEFLFASTAADCGRRLDQEKHNVIDWEKLRDHIRGAMRCHRFTVISWLLTNGVKIPVALLDDESHPEVGSQTVDILTR